MNLETEIRTENIELLCLIKAILKNIWLIVLAALTAFMAVQLVLDRMYVPQYSSTVTYAVMSKSGSSDTYANLNAANEVATLFSDLMQSKLIDEDVCAALGVESMPGSIRSTVIGQTNMIQVTATAPSPKTAYQMIKALDGSYGVYSDHIARTAVLYTMTAPQVSGFPSNYVNSSEKSRMAAIVAGIGMTLLIAYMNIQTDTIQTKAGAENKLDGPVLVSVPHEKKIFGKKHASSDFLITSPLVSSFFQETFHRLRVAVESELEHQSTDGGKVILITSTVASEGKSTVAANLALALAQQHKSVVLIDTDLRNPTQIQMFGRTSVRGEGLIGLLRADHLDTRSVIEAASYDQNRNLIMIFPGAPAADASDLLACENMAELIRLVRRSADYIVVDTPPLGLFSDSDMLASLCDGSLLVVQQDKVAAPDINDMADVLRESGSTFMGFVLNDFKTIPFGVSSKEYGYGYGYYFKSGSARTGSHSGQ